MFLIFFFLYRSIFCNRLFNINIWINVLGVSLVILIISFEYEILKFVLIFGTKMVLLVWYYIANTTAILSSIFYTPNRSAYINVKKNTAYIYHLFILTSLDSIIQFLTPVWRQLNVLYCMVI